MTRTESERRVEGKLYHQQKLLGRIFCVTVKTQTAKSDDANEYLFLLFIHISFPRTSFQSEKKMNETFPFAVPRAKFIPLLRFIHLLLKALVVACCCCISFVFWERRKNYTQTSKFYFCQSAKFLIFSEKKLFLCAMKRKYLK